MSAMALDVAGPQTQTDGPQSPFMMSSENPRLFDAFESSFVEEEVPRLLACTQGRLPRPEDLTGAPCAVTSLSASADGRVLCSASHNGNIEFYSLPELQPLGEITAAHGGMAVHEVSMVPDVSFCASCGSDGSVRGWRPSASTGKWQMVWCSRRHEAHDGTSNDKNKRDALQPWATNGWPHGHTRGHNKWVTDVLSVATVFCGPTESAKQGICASGGSDCSLRLYKLEDGASLFCSRAHRGAVTRVRGGVSGPRPLLATISEDKALRLWCVEWPLPSGGPECIWVVEEAHKAPISSLSLVAPRINTTGGMLATGDSNGVLKVWHLKTGRCLREFDEGRGSHCLGVALALGVPTPGGKADAWAFSCCAKGGLRGWRFPRVQGRAVPAPPRIVSASPIGQKAQSIASPSKPSLPKKVLQPQRATGTRENLPAFSRGAGFRYNNKLAQTASAWLCVGGVSQKSEDTIGDGSGAGIAVPSNRLYQRGRRMPAARPDLAPALSSWRGHSAKVQRAFLSDVSEKHLVFESQSSAHPTTGSQLPIHSLTISQGMLISGSADGSIQVRVVDVDEYEPEPWSANEPAGGCRQM